MAVKLDERFPGRFVTGSTEVRGSFSDPLFFDIVDEMKGHVGDGVCIRGFGARVCRLK